MLGQEKVFPDPRESALLLLYQDTQLRAGEVFVSYLLSVQALGWLFGWSKEKNVEPSSLGSSCNYQKSQELSEFWKRMAIWRKYTRRGCSGKLWLPARSHPSGRTLD